MDRIAQYSVGKTDERDTLFILYAGANDAYFSLQEGGTPPEVLADLKECVEMLRGIGARALSLHLFRPRMLTFCGIVVRFRAQAPSTSSSRRCRRSGTTTRTLSVSFLISWSSVLVLTAFVAP